MIERPIASGAAAVQEDLASSAKSLVIGQDEAIDIIVPYIELYQSGLSPAGRPVGVFLLAGPTGTGKTHTVEVLAEVLHGSRRNVLRVDCGEFQMEHEVAKLIGAPPGYLGHRETQPMINQKKINAAASERSALSLVLFDEIEKAAPSMQRLLLGILDQATMKLGDGSSANFERSLVFMTSNLGAKEMQQKLTGGYGFDGAKPGAALEKIGMGAIRKAFTPEFINRIDKIITFRPLGDKEVERILELELRSVQSLLDERLGPATFTLDVRRNARLVLLDSGVSEANGAREMKRVIHREIVQPMARMVLDRKISAGGILICDARDGMISMEAAR